MGRQWRSKAFMPSVACSGRSIEGEPAAFASTNQDPQPTKYTSRLAVLEDIFNTLASSLRQARWRRPAQAYRISPQRSSIGVLPCADLVRQVDANAEACRANGCAPNDIGILWGGRSPGQRVTCTWCWRKSPPP